MRIVKLEAKNVKRLRAVEITPTGDVITISGRNAQGKSSLLDSIAMALGGKDWQGEKPIRDGATKGKIVCKLSNGMTITRSLTPSGGSLAITAEDGSKFANPQKVLDALYGNHAFDPLAFSREKPKEQRDTLQKLVGIDFADLDAERQESFDERTAVNRRVKELEAQVAGAVQYADVPAEEVSVSALVTKLGEAEAVNRSYAAKIQQVASLKATWDSIEKRIVDLKTQLAQAERDLKQTLEFIVMAEKDADAIKPIDTAPIRTQINSADDINKKVRSNIARADLKKKLLAEQDKSDALTKAIDGIETAKQSMMQRAKFPVDGLSFDADGVLFKGIPFSQASSAEQLRVSVAIGLAAHPELRVMLIRDGSLLDSNSLAIIGEMAKSTDSQIWLECVDESGKVGIVIEDGMVIAENVKELATV